MMLQNLLSKKLLSTGGGIGSVAFIAYLVSIGTLAPPIGLAFAGLAVIGAAVHVIVQGKVDKEKAKPNIEEAARAVEMRAIAEIRAATEALKAEEAGE